MNTNGHVRRGDHEPRSSPAVTGAAVQKRVNKIESRIPRQRDDSSCLFAHCHTILYDIHIRSDDRVSGAGSLELLSGVGTRRSQTHGQRAGRRRPPTTTSYTIYTNTRSIATPIGEDNTPIGDSGRVSWNRGVRRCHHQIGIHNINYNLSW